ncbi:hypothetical protein GJ744_003917 [Endocarpon pusillum]|uniref:DUF7580 domain-containing protein n=1 Tax=Endocarpon pusillum TaxID=364733 RepID=A0A8H7DZI3_9EURO|nr:hypothetical protein GJ744_003917 [Endocarpon pusillum]
MLTGIETVGLVLASFPFLIAALDHYKAGLEPFQTYSHYKLRLTELKGDLAFHRAKFLQSLTLLLNRCIQPKLLGQLLGDPGGREWKDPDLAARLSKCLGSFDFSVFIDVVSGFKSTLDELYTKLDVDQDGQPKWSDKDAFERAFHRIRFSFLHRDKIKELKKRLKDRNKQLSSIAKSSVALAPYCERRAVLEEDVDRFREHVSNLDSSLKSAPWGCHCMFPHIASLRVGNPTYSRTTGTESTCYQRQSACRGLDVLFSFHDQGSLAASPPRWNWHETHFEPETSVPTSTCSQVDGAGGSGDRLASTSHPTYMTGNQNEGQLSGPNKLKKRKQVHWPTSSTAQTSSPTPSPQAMREIRELCLQLASVQEGAPPLGFLPLDPPLRFVVYPVKRHPRPTVSSTDDMVNLEDLLERKFAPQNPTKIQGKLFLAHKKIEMPDRLYLAYVLSWIFLRLYGTSFLDSAWGLKDVQFLRRLDGTRDPALMEPFVSKSFHPISSLPTPPKSAASSSSSSTSTASRLTIGPGQEATPHIVRTLRSRNHGVFILGVSLVEVFFHKRLHEMYAAADLDFEGKETEETPYLALERLIYKIRQKAGDRYGNAVRRCIRCEFDQWYDDINCADFRQAFYQKVVVPLEENWRTFTGRSALP